MSEYQKYRNKKYSKIFIYCVNNEAQVLHNSSCALKIFYFFYYFIYLFFFWKLKTVSIVLFFFLAKNTMLSAYIKDTASLLVLEMLSGFTVYSFTSTTMKTQINNSLASKILLE